MYLDITPAAEGTYNRKLARLAGLPTAVYWNMLLVVFDRVAAKHTYDENGFFTLDREYIQAQTSLDLKQQTECDAVLVKLGLLDLDPVNPDRMRSHVKEYVALIIESDLVELANIQKVAKSATKVGKAEGKKAGMIKNMRSVITDTDENLVKAYYAWIDSAYTKGMTSKAQVDVFRKKLNDYTNEPAIQIGILEVATTYAYKEFDWAKQIYEKNHPGRLGGQRVITDISEISEITF